MRPPRPDDSDATLMALAATGSRPAYNLIVRRYQEPLYRFIRRYVGDADEAYDLLQDTFIAAWQALSRYDLNRPPLTWFRRIALNKCRDWSRRRTVRRFFYGAASLDASQSTTDVASMGGIDDSEEAALTSLDRAIAALPVQLKEPLLLTVFEGLSHVAAGEALGISPKAIETRVYRARKLLADTLKRDGLDIDEG